METSSGLEKIAEPGKKPNSLKHKLKVLAAAVPLALMSYAPAAIAQDTHATRPAEKKELISIASYTDLRGTFGGSISLGKINDATKSGFRAGFFAEPKKSQNIRFTPPPYERYADDYYWTIVSEKFSGGITADWLLGKSDRLLIGLGGGLGFEVTKSSNNLHDGLIHLDAQSANGSLYSLDEYIYSDGDLTKVFGRARVSASFPVSKRLLAGIEAGADVGRRPVYGFPDFIYQGPLYDSRVKPHHRNNFILGINLTYILNK
jgi:hypothetical protein